MAQPWTARILTLFPEMFPGPLGHSLTGRALADALWALDVRNIRDAATDRHRSVDDSPCRWRRRAWCSEPTSPPPRSTPPTAGCRASAGPCSTCRPAAAASTRGRARALAAGPGVTLLCGRFEGVDERVLAARAVEEVSLGDFVLTGGEIAAMALIDATVRLIPRVLGNAKSTVEESFSSGLLESPQYTSPTEWEGLRIPEVLLSGHHGRIAEWRREEAERLTKERRPDLWRAYVAKAPGCRREGDRALGRAAHRRDTRARKGRG